MKGQQQVIVMVLVMLILIVSLAAIYTWAVPIIEKSQDRFDMERAEKFMDNLNKKIRNVANSGGKDYLETELGIISFDGTTITLELDTKETNYLANEWVSLTTSDCSDNIGDWKNDPPEILCVYSKVIGEVYKIIYTLSYRELNAGEKSYKIELIGTTARAGAGHQIRMERKNFITDADLVKAEIEIKII
jgi:hypothetical protein